MIIDVSYIILSLSVSFDPSTSHSNSSSNEPRVVDKNDIFNKKLHSRTLKQVSYTCIACSPSGERWPDEGLKMNLGPKREDDDLMQ